MKITRIEIVNFRNHTHSLLEPDTFNVVRGGNFQGKSSIAQAISLCLTPTTMGLDNTGRGFATKIRRGANKGVLIADIQGKVHLVQRTVTLNTNTTGRADSSKCIDDPEWHPSPFEKQLDNNRPALAVVLNTDRFFTMDEKEQKSLLAKLALPKQYDFSEETMNAVDKAIGVGTIDFDGEPFAVIEKAYKLLYKERELVNRQAKEFVVPDPLPLVGVQVSALQTKLAEARERQKTMSAQRDEAINRNHETNLRQSKLIGKIDSLKEKINEETNRIEGIQGFLSEAKLKDLTKVAAGKATFDKLDAERLKLISKAERKKANIEAYGKLTGASGEECPTCHQEVSGTVMAELLRTATTDLQEIGVRGREVLQEQKSLGDITGAVKALAAHEKATKDKAEIENVINEKSKLLQDTTNELSKLPTTTEVLIPFVQPLDEVDHEITGLIAQLQPALAAEEREKEIAAKTEQLTKLKAKAASVDALVKVFDKDGIKADLLKEHVGGFVDKMNTVMAAFGYKVELDIEPDFMFVVTDTNNVITPVKELAGSEQLMFVVALQCAVSKAAGIGIVVADKMDTFLPPQRLKANKVLYTLLQDGVLEQVFVIVSDESKEPIKLPNAACFFVENGTVRKL